MVRGRERHQNGHLIVCIEKGVGGQKDCWCTRRCCVCGSVDYAVHFHGVLQLLLRTHKACVVDQAKAAISGEGVQEMLEQTECVTA